MAIITKIDFITRQLKRTHNKKYENYVLTRIWHGINSLEVKMVTQQYVMREDGCALLDAYFPQFNIGIEVDEHQHKLKENIELDKLREKDIVNAIACIIYRVDVTESIESIHQACDLIVSRIKEEMKHSFYPWDIKNEYKAQKYIDKGYIAVDDNVAFRTQVDALQCFGIYYKSTWTGGENHPVYDDVHIWFPKMSYRADWINTFIDNEETLLEENENETKNTNMVKVWLSETRTIRYVFAYTKDNLGFVLYRFKGIYELDKKETARVNKAVWRRTGSKVQTTKEVLKGNKL